LRGKEKQEMKGKKEREEKDWKGGRDEREEKGYNLLSSK